MFRQLAAASSPDEVLTGFRPSQLAEFLEVVWSSPRNPVRQLALGPELGLLHDDMGRRDVLDPLPAAAPQPPHPDHEVGWHHLVYAYMLENTRLVDIFRRVCLEWLTGERLPLPSQPSQRWLHCTEQLFFGAPWAYSVRAVTSTLRPDAAGVRRNAYYRLLGMDLNHGTDDGQVYPYVKPAVANREFAAVFEALLIEVWKAYVNRFTAVSENLTDDNAIDTLIRRLREMLLSRRRAGALSREEFDAVTMASWFHLTVESNTRVVLDLNAHASGIADRLAKIGELVGVPAHARSDAYFRLAEPLSMVLIAIESDDVASPRDLYDEATGRFTPEMLEIITQWSVATGRNLKDPTARVPISNVLRQLPVSPAVSAPVTGTASPVGGRVGALLR
ncbi:MAG TPA: hypothetical protein VEA99_05575 [Gemmatimonadaceae bacterium]|nr:hypothetical protein [Gemmatimonadaceae bacterium]